MINTRLWKEFKLERLFDISAGNYYSTDEYEEGDTPYISASATNNAISQRINLSADFKGNVLITGKIGSVCFYQVEDFCATSDVNIFRPKKFALNQNLGLFLATIINFSENYKWSYGRQCRVGDSNKIIIKLPIQVDSKGKPIIDDNKDFSDEGYIPDWEFMENYIINRENDISIKETLNTKNKNNKISDLKIEYWKDFSLGEIFEEIYKSKAYIKSELTVFDENDEKRIPFISRTDKNNGCDCYVPLEEIETFELGSCIIIGDTTSTIYYQNENFVTGDHIVVCRAKWINKYTALFIKTIIEKERYKYNYGRAFKMELIKTTKIILPIKRDGNGEPIIDNNYTYSHEGYIPDWEFMESYIKSIPYGDKI